MRSFDRASFASISAIARRESADHVASRSASGAHASSASASESESKKASVAGTANVRTALFTLIRHANSASKNALASSINPGGRAKTPPWRVSNRSAAWTTSVRWPDPGSARDPSAVFASRPRVSPSMNEGFGSERAPPPPPPPPFRTRASRADPMPSSASAASAWAVPPDSFSANCAAAATPIFKSHAGSGARLTSVGFAPGPTARSPSSSSSASGPGRFEPSFEARELASCIAAMALRMFALTLAVFAWCLS